MNGMGFINMSIIYKNAENANWTGLVYNLYFQGTGYCALKGAYEQRKNCGFRSSLDRCGIDCYFFFGFSNKALPTPDNTENTALNVPIDTRCDNKNWQPLLWFLLLLINVLHFIFLIF